MSAKKMLVNAALPPGARFGDGSASSVDPRVASVKREHASQTRVKTAHSPKLDGFLYHSDGVVGFVYQDTVFVQQAPELSASTTPERTAFLSHSEPDTLSVDSEWIPSSDGFIYHALVPDRVAPKSVAEAGLRNLGGLFLVGVQRGSRFLAAVGPTFEILSGDLLGFAGTTDNFSEFCKSKNLVSFGDSIEEGLLSLASREFVFTTTEQAIVRSRSWLIGKSAKEVGFRSLYAASIVSIARPGEIMPSTMWGTVRFKAGDSLVLLKSDEFDWKDPQTARDLKTPSIFKRL